MKNTKAKNKTSFSTVRKYNNSNKESFCVFIDTSQLQASPSNEISYAYSALKNMLKIRRKETYSQTKVSSVFTSYLNRRKMQIKCLPLLLFYKNFDGFPKLYFNYEVPNTHMYMDSTTYFFHSTNCISHEFMRKNPHHL